VLSRLSATEYKRIESDLETVPLVFGQTIYKSKGDIDYLYFPESGLFSIVGMPNTGKPIEIGLVGSEGFVGLSLLLGVSRSPNEIIVRADGTAHRIAARAALAEFAHFGNFHDAVLLFAHELFLQLSQVTSCNRHHPVEQRLSRWLLMMRERVHNDRFSLTQEFLSWMLGVRHQAVSRAASLLQEGGAIKYSRGVVTIVNRTKLEGRACGCYRVSHSRSNHNPDKPRPVFVPQ
jgi:CRP-like cAMP-binding protein